MPVPLPQNTQGKPRKGLQIHRLMPRCLPPGLCAACWGQRHTARPDLSMPHVAPFAALMCRDGACADRFCQGQS